MLSAAGAQRLGSALNRVPYFPGRWRVLDRVFHRWFKNSGLQVDVPLNSAVTIRCDLWDEVQFGIWAGRERYEIGPSRFLKKRLMPRAVLLDIGANAGYYSLLAAPRVGPEGRVYAFEPMSVLFAKLNENVRRNQLAQIQTRKLALSDRCGSAALHLTDAHNTGSASLRPVGSAPVAHREAVECVTLDHFVRQENPSRVDFLKIDVEGLELAVLRGGVETIQRFRPVILLEALEFIQRRAGNSRDEIFAFLETLGYKAYRIKNSGGVVPLQQPADGTLILFQPGS